MVGTPKTIADEMEEWLHSGGCDGFNIMFPYVPGGLDDFVDRVVPELQCRGLFRRDYEGRTLRENLGLLVHPNRFYRRATEQRRRRADRAKRIETVGVFVGGRLRGGGPSRHTRAMIAIEDR